MGTSQSTTVEKQRPNLRPFGQIYLETDPRAYYEEEMVTGNVYLNLHRHYAKCKLTIELKGKEKSHFEQVRRTTHDDSDCGCTTTDVSDFKSKGSLYESTFTICNWDDLEIGQYAVPFSIRLPKGLYSSFECEEIREKYAFDFDYSADRDKDTYKASVMYRLTARLEPAIKGLPPLKYKHQINIRGTPPKNKLEQSKMLEIPRMSLFCWSRGKTFVSIDLDRDFANYGEYLPVKLTVDNSQSNLQSEMITIKLVHSLSLKAQDRVFEERITKYKKRLAGIPAGKISQENLINIELMHGGMQSTVDAGLVRSSYELEISVGDGIFEDSANKCVIPINIGCGNGVYIPMEIPQGWNPRQVPTLNAALQVGAALEKAVDAGFALLEKKNGEISATDMINHNNLYKPLLQTGNKYY